MSTETQPNPTRRISLWRYFPWLFACGCIAAIFMLYRSRDGMDGGQFNVFRAMLTFMTWGWCVLGLMLTARSRWPWLVTLLVPVLFSAAFLSRYRLERVDSEINPVFVSRWKAAESLPDVAPAPTSDNTVKWNDDFFAPRATDHPGFLGPRHDASYPDLHLESNWQNNPPEIAWKQPIGDGWSGFAVQGDAAYTMEQRDNEEWVTCYDANSGKLLWHYTIEGLHFHPMGGTGPRATPTIHDGKLYALSAISQLVCLDLHNGNKLWSVELLELTDATQAEFEAVVTWGRSASPLIVDDLVVVPLGGVPGKSIATLIAFDFATGEERWRGGEDQISYSTPVLATIGDRPQLLYVSEKNLLAFDPRNGEQLWSSEWPGSSSGAATVSQPIAIDDSQVLLSKGYAEGAKLLRISPKDSAWQVEEVWRDNAVLKTKFTSCVLRDGYAYGLSDGILECVRVADGQRAWKKGRYRHGQVLLVGEQLLITAEDGELVLVDADPTEFRELAKLPVLGDVTWNTPAISGNRLLMRNSDEAACVLLPTDGTHSHAGGKAATDE